VQGTSESIVELAAHGRLTVRRHGNRYMRFPRAGADLSEIGERVYVNATADHATDLLRTVVKDVVDNPRDFPGARMAKLIGPVGIPRRPDGIVIYVADAAEASRVVDRLRRIQGAARDMFRHSTPAMTEQVLEGVSLVRSRWHRRVGSASVGGAAKRCAMRWRTRCSAAAGRRSSRQPSRSGCGACTSTRTRRT
jgi:hypothetical protein